jgi:sugar lactone lactonase YvrE
VAALVLIKILYGRGTPYPDMSGVPLVAKDSVVAVMDLDFPPGNVTGSRDGRIFFNTHPLAESHRFASAFLFELVGGSASPYPDAASQDDLRFTFGMTVDGQNRLWLTSPANFDRERTRLIAFDLATNRKVVDHELEPGVARFGQDLRITPDGRTVLLANPGVFRMTASSLVVVDIATWHAREVLRGDPSVQPQDWLMRVRGQPYRLAYGLLSFQIGIDGIAIDPNGRWLFFAPMSQDSAYRVPLADVINADLPGPQLSADVERVGKKPLSDGIDAGPDGSILITDVEHGGIARLDERGRLTTLATVDRVTWADGVFLAPNGDVYFTDSAIPLYIDPLMRPPSVDRLRAGRPYHLYRFRCPR